MSKKIKAKLVIDVTYDSYETTEDQIKQVLNKAASHLAAQGMLSGDLSAEVDDWDSSVETKRVQE